jgi:hypothetical protein
MSRHAAQGDNEADFWIAGLDEPGDIETETRDHSKGGEGILPDVDDEGGDVVYRPW